MITIYYHLIGETSEHFQNELKFMTKAFKLVIFKTLEDFDAIPNKLYGKSVLRCTVNFIHTCLNTDYTLLSADTRQYLQTKLHYKHNLNLYNCMQYLDNSLMLNTGKFVKLKDIENKYLAENTKLFIKPSSVLKYFDATFIESEYPIGNYLTYNFNIDMSEELCIISDIKIIDAETRFFVINGKVLTGSYYRIDNIYCEKAIQPDEEIFSIAQKYVDLYKPCKAFVIDIVLTDNQYKIIEYNPINCAGIYACDYNLIMQKLADT